MIVLRPDGRLRLDEQLARACTSRPGQPRRTMLVLIQGTTGALEPLVTVDEILDGLDNELQLVVTDGWSPAFWARECELALEVANVEGGLDFAPSPDQRRRAHEQTADDGRVEVLFVERGRIVGSALTLVAPRRANGPAPLNTKVAAMELLQAARDAMAWEPRLMKKLVADAREALGIPAGPMTTIAQVRRARGDRPLEPVRVVEDVAEAVRRAAQGRTPTVTPVAKAAKPAVSRPEERHTLEGGACTTCGRKGDALQAPCGRPELGRFGLIELE